MIKTILSSSLVKQLLGAAGGALVALTFFTVYHEAKPMVRAYLLPVEETTEVSEAIRETSINDAAVRLRDAAAQARNQRLLQQIPVSDFPTSAPEAAELLPALTSTAPALPDSGIGLGMSIVIALMISIGLRMWRLSRFS